MEVLECMTMKLDEFLRKFYPTILSSYTVSPLFHGFDTRYSVLASFPGSPYSGGGEPGNETTSALGSLTQDMPMCFSLAKET